MKEIFEQYGGAIITVIAIVALAAVVTLVLDTGENGVILSAFKDLINNLKTMGLGTGTGAGTGTGTGGMFIY